VERVDADAGGEAGTWAAGSAATFGSTSNGRDRTKLVEGMSRQVEVLRRTLNAESPAVPVHPVLCFVGATWPRFRRRPLTIRGVTILWPDALTQLLTTPRDAPTHDGGTVAAIIGQALRPA